MAAGGGSRKHGVSQTACVYLNDSLFLQSHINIIKDTKLSAAAIGSLATFVEGKTYGAGEYVLKEGQTTEAALYLIHHGKVELTSNGATLATLASFCHFGEEMMLVDQIAGSNGPSDPTTAVSPYTAHVIEECQVGILFLEDCRKVFDTLELGKGGDSVIDSLFQRQVKLGELKKHTILGAGKTAILCQCLVSNRYEASPWTIQPITSQSRLKREVSHYALVSFRTIIV
jgi:CRP-like cAMP-binding protein